MLPLARHLQARPLQGGNHRGAIRDGPRFDALAQIVGNQPPGVFLRLQPGPKLGGFDVGPMAGLHVPRPLRIVRTAPAVLVVLPVPQRSCARHRQDQPPGDFRGDLPVTPSPRSPWEAGGVMFQGSRSRDIQALAGLKIAAAPPEHARGHPRPLRGAGPLPRRSGPVPAPPRRFSRTRPARGQFAHRSGVGA